MFPFQQPIQNLGKEWKKKRIQLMNESEITLCKSLETGLLKRFSGEKNPKQPDKPWVFSVSKTQAITVDVQ